jgi:hypothetical protein
MEDQLWLEVGKMGVDGANLLQPSETKTRGEFRKQILVCMYIYTYRAYIVYIYILYTYTCAYVIYTMRTRFFPRIKRPGRI